MFVTATFDIDGERVTVERCLRYRVNVGMIVEVWLYDHQQHLVDQAWSQP